MDVLSTSFLLIAFFNQSVANAEPAAEEQPVHTPDRSADKPRAGNGALLDLSTKVFRGRADSSNSAFSPLTTMSNLALLSLGAAGDTRQQIHQLLPTLETLIRPDSRLRKTLADAKFDADSSPSGELADIFGVRIEPKDGALHVTAIIEKSEAERSGLRKGDILAAVNGESVSTIGDFVQQLRERTEVNLTLLRTVALKGAEGPSPTSIGLQIGSSLWLSAKAGVRAEFSQKAKDLLGADVFEFVPETAHNSINEWVGSRTAVTGLVQPADIDLNTTLILISVLKFQGQWEYPFADTKEGTFQTSTGVPKKVQMMGRVAQLKYWETPDASAVELPYSGGRYCMIAVLPRPGVNAVENAGTVLEGALSGLESASIRKVDVTIPQFRFSSTIDLSQPLKEVGFQVLFTDAANLSGISEKQSRVDFMRQVVTVVVDQRGTDVTSAQATGVVTFSPAKPFKVDRPFLFLILDKVTRYVIVVGHVADPLWHEES